MKKIIFVVVDGLGDLPVPEIDYRTPLQASNLPNLDYLCRIGLSGMMDPVMAGLACGSDTAHLSIFGYDPQLYYRGRGAFEAMGSGLEMLPGDIAFKCNFACLDKDGIVVLRKPDRKFEREAQQLCEYLENINLLPSHPEYQVKIQYSKEHRCVIRVSGPKLTDTISGTDPLKDGLKLVECAPTMGESLESVITCKVVNQLDMNIRRALESHPINLERTLQGLPPANVVLLRGPSIAIDVPPFHQVHRLNTALVAPTSIIAGIGKTLGMTLLKAPGATGNFDTDMISKAQTAMEALFSSSSPICYDMVIVHVKCVDDCGHDGDVKRKIAALERVDEMIEWILQYLKTLKESHIIAVTGDHSTPITLQDHSPDPVPFLLALAPSLGQAATPLTGEIQFDEVSCAQGALGRFPGIFVMEILKKFRDNTNTSNSNNNNNNNSISL